MQDAAGGIADMEDRVASDVELLRNLALELATRERSPPEPTVLDFSELSSRLSSSADAIEGALEKLASMALIDGPGAYADAWLFRRLTAKGRFFIEEVRSDRRWTEIKSIYGSGRNADER